ncbi:hypothetical protein [Pueribacillus sp. YX66]|uniref:hypothetical protein n=1 Tax=Pueribacillus sp. YX66 TaxID=3229242 RepID=UPI00358D94E3
MLTLQDIQNIVNAVLEETDKNDEFREFALVNMDEAIDFIVRRDFSFEMQKRYEQTVTVYRRLNLHKTGKIDSKGLATHLQLSSFKKPL